MEMSGFARLEGSLPVTADIGVAWPVLASHIEDSSGWSSISFPRRRRLRRARRCEMDRRLAFNLWTAGRMMTAVREGAR